MIRFVSLQWFILEQWRRNQLAATFSAGLIGAGFTLVMPFLPYYIAQLGVRSEAAVAIWSGLILGISPLIASFVGPIWGKLADRYGLKIMAIRISLVLFLIWFLMGLARDVYELLALRILSGLFGGFGSLSVSLVTHSTPSARVGRAIGGLQATQTFSMAIGPVSGRSARSLDWCSEHLLCYSGALFPEPAAIPRVVPRQIRSRISRTWARQPKLPVRGHRPVQAAQPEGSGHASVRRYGDRTKFRLGHSAVHGLAIHRCRSDSAHGRTDPLSGGGRRKPGCLVLRPESGACVAPTASSLPIGFWPGFLSGVDLGGKSCPTACVQGLACAAGGWHSHHCLQPGQAE